MVFQPLSCMAIHLPEAAGMQRVNTMVEIAKAHDLNIYGYLKFLLEHRPAKEMTDDHLAELALGAKNSNRSKITCEI